MATAAQIIANRDNAQHSTGPKTGPGKAASSQNATRHGLSSAHFAILPNEDPAQYDQLHQSLTAEFEPTTDHERFLVELMAKSKFKLYRIERLESAALDEILADPTAGPDAQILTTLKAGNNVLDKLHRYQAAAERSYYKAHRELQAGRAAGAAKQNEANAFIVDALFNGPVRPRPARKSAAETTPVQNEPKPAARPVRAMAASAALRL